MVLWALGGESRRGGERWSGLTKSSLSELPIDDDILSGDFPIVELQTGMPRAQNAQPVHPIGVFLHALELLVKSKEDDDDEDGADDGPDHVEKGQRLGTSGIVFVIQAQPLVQRPHFAPAARKEGVVPGLTSALGVAQWRSTVMNRDLSTGPLELVGK